MKSKYMYTPTVHQVFEFIDSGERESPRGQESAWLSGCGD